MNPAVPPDPLTRRQRIIVALVALLCAATRFLPLARSVWDWDEALFTMALRDYDVTQHHPHPPGFPVYIALAKLVRLFVADDFRALQTINVVAAMLVFPAVFFFARELRLRFRTSVMAGALFAFFPNVWFFGGGAFSDVPSIVLVLFAVTFLLKGARDRNAYWFGTFLLALAIGIRPQNFLLGFLPGLYATRKRRPLEVLVALQIGLAVVGAAFGGAIYATGPADDYFRTVREHGDYISRIDSWRSPDRPPMWRIFDRFFIKQYQSPVLSIIASIFVIVSVAGSIRERSRPMLFNALTFVPFAFFAWMMLDRFSISRFSIGYQPMFALFLADGIRRAGDALERRLTRGNGGLSAKPAAPAIAAALIAGFALYSVPAFTAVRNEIAPSILAVRAAAQHVDPRREQLFVGHTMSVFMDFVRPGFPYTRVIDDRAMPLHSNRPAWLLAEITETPERGLLFRRERGSLWNIARRHYFEIKLERIESRPRFVSGWYAPEASAIHQWRWMGKRSLTILPPAAGRTLLRMHLSVPYEVVPQRPEVTVRLNGRVIDRFRTDRKNFERDYRVHAAPNGQPNVLELSTDRGYVPADDRRELGLRLGYLAWGAS